MSLLVGLGTLTVLVASLLFVVYSAEEENELLRLTGRMPEAPLTLLVYLGRKDGTEIYKYWSKLFRGTHGVNICAMRTEENKSTAYIFDEDGRIVAYFKGKPKFRTKKRN